MQALAAPRPAESEPPAGLLASEILAELEPRLSKTRVRGFEVFCQTRLEPLGFVTGTAVGTSADSWRKIASDLSCFLSEDPGGYDPIAAGAEDRLLRHLLPPELTMPDPESGSQRFARVPDVGDPLDRSLGEGYLYADNDPTAYTDPTGAKGIPRWIHWARRSSTAYKAYRCGKGNADCNRAVDEFCCTSDYHTRLGRVQICKFDGYACCRRNFYRCWFFMDPQPCVPR